MSNKKKIVLSILSVIVYLLGLSKYFDSDKYIEILYIVTFAILLLLYFLLNTKRIVLSILTTLFSMLYYYVLLYVIYFGRYSIFFGLVGQVCYLFFIMVVSDLFFTKKLSEYKFVIFTVGYFVVYVLYCLVTGYPLFKSDDLFIILKSNNITFTMIASCLFDLWIFIPVILLYSLIEEKNYHPKNMNE